MSRECKVIYNFDPSHVSSIPSDGCYDEPITKEYVESFVKEVAGRSVDTFALCPNMLRRKLWDSKYDPHWSKEAPFIKKPDNQLNIGHDNLQYFRMRDYMLSGGQPVREIYEAVRKTDMNFFFTYRMNDCHYLENPKSLIPDTFWRDHPEYRIKEYGGVHPNMHPSLCNILQNYMYPEVRQHYLNILTELTEGYDIDGLELDFMRKPCLMPITQLEEGRGVITAFVRSVREMLDRVGAQRNKQIQLAVRVPHSVQACWDVGMDIAAWDNEGLVDIITASTSFLHNMFALNLNSFRQVIRHAKLFAEMHFSFAYGKAWPYSGVKFIRNTTKEQYETAAYYLSHAGADGVTLFNFVGTRHHRWLDPRSTPHFGAEPPLKAMDHLNDPEYLETCPKHYFINRFIVDGREYADCALPAVDDFKFTLHLYERNLQGTYTHAVMRVDTEDLSCHLPLVAYINGQRLEEFVGTGELFTPVSIEGLPPLENMRYFRVPMDLLRSGDNMIEVHNAYEKYPRDFCKYTGVELALYTHERNERI